MVVIHEFVAATAATASLHLLLLLALGAPAVALYASKIWPVAPSSAECNRRAARRERPGVGMSASLENGDVDPSAEVRILALHGKGGSGTEFEGRIDPLADALADRLRGGRRVVVDCPTAPFDLGPDGGGGRAWWTLPPGVRSFNAKEYIGFEESASVVADALISGDGYDIVLGHSQGAILLSALLARGDIPPRNGGRQSKPKGYILNGAAWPNPYSSQLSEFRWTEQGDDDGSAPPRCLFVVGSSDSINPPEGARRVRDALSDAGMRVETADHAGGHSVPVRDENALAYMVGWMAELLEGK